MKLKKLLGGLALVVFAFSFTSCKKDWTCVCKVNGISANEGNASFPDMTKKDAETACEAHEKTINLAIPEAKCSID